MLQPKTTLLTKTMLSYLLVKLIWKMLRYTTLIYGHNNAFLPLSCLNRSVGRRIEKKIPKKKKKIQYHSTKHFH